MVVVVLSLMTFATSAYFIFNRFEASQYDSIVLEKSIPLIELLLPKPDADSETYAAVIEEIGSALEFDISVYDKNQQILVSTGNKLPLGFSDFQLGVWNVSDDQRRWSTKLADGRWVVVDLRQAPEMEEFRTLIVVLFSTAIVLILVMYPVIRSLTSRLEDLQTAAVKVGSGKLRTRVEVQGNDEVALVAESFNKAIGQIEKLVSSQRLLLANTSHELRTPLARIRLGLDLLEDQISPERYLAIKSDIIELNQLIDDLLLLSRLDVPDFAMNIGPVDLAAVASEECGHYEGCSFACDTIDEMDGDEKMLRRLLRNLLDNAQKHGAQPICVAIRSNKQTIDLVVSDAGPGIVVDDQDHIFDAFYRAADRQNIPGYGLGLALVKSIADAHGAEIEFRSEPCFAIAIRFPHLPSRQV